MNEQFTNNLFDLWEFEKPKEGKTSETLKSLICDEVKKILSENEDANITTLSIFINTYLFIYGGGKQCK